MQTRDLFVDLRDGLEKARCINVELSQRIWYLEKKLDYIRDGKTCHAAHPGELTLECDVNDQCPNCRLQKAERKLEQQMHELAALMLEKADVQRIGAELLRENKELQARNLTIPSEHSFAEHEAYLTACAKVEELANKLHDCEHNWACEQNEMRCAVAEVLDYDKGSYDGCDVLAEVTALKHNHDRAMEVLAATTRQRDQLNIEANQLHKDLNRYKIASQELNKTSKGYRELQSAIAQVLGNDIDEGADDLDILQEFTALKARLDEMQKVLAPKPYCQ
jgi:hypothetical protein